MNSQPQPRNYAMIAVAIVIAAVVLAGGIVAATYVGKSTVTNTTTSTAFQITTSIVISTTTTTITSTTLSPDPGGSTTLTTTVYSESGLYNVTFEQIGACSPPVYTVPWSVTLGGKTQAEPPNTPLPIANGSYSAGPEPPGLYTIVFTSVPDGVYQYKIAPSGPFYTTSGTVTVNGTNVSVPVNGPVVSCRITTATG